jgi:serine/threonine protein kinase/tetratricopeptide (TPR) repeat protein
MPSVDWNRAKELFEAAVELPEAEASAYLDAECSGFPELHSMVSTLIRNHRELSGQDQQLQYHLDAGRTIRVLENGMLVAKRFRILRFIASGGMGEVYEAMDEWLGAKLALKTLRPEMLSAPGSIDRFKRELLIARRVTHENVCRVFDFAEHHTPDAAPGRSSTPCFTMELLEGESLASYLSTRRPLPLCEALLLIRQIAAGLSTLHAHGLVHRDIKPSNIMIVAASKGGKRAVVMDFGLTKPLGTESDMFQSAPEFHGGAPYFMDPELLRGAKPGIASDVYSFGLLVDEMVTSQRAFTSQSVQSLYYEKLWETPVAPSRRSKNLPQRWEESLLRCLDPDPTKRFSSIAEAARAFEEPPLESASATGPSPPPVRRTFLSGPPAERRRRQFLAALAGAPIAVGAIAMGSIVWSSGDSSIEVFDIENQTGNPEFDYICRGTTAEILRQLLEVRGVQVYAMRMPRTNAPARQATGRFCLNGMLQVHLNQVRLSIQLFDNGRNGHLVWTRKFESAGLQDPLGLQSDIARNTIAALEREVWAGQNAEASISPFTRAAVRMRQAFFMPAANDLPGPPTVSNEALDLYMRGRSLLEELSPTGAARSLEYFKMAIDRDSKFALAYAGAADATMALMNYNYRPHVQLAEEARYFADRAVLVGQRLAEAHSVLAAVRQMDWDWKGAEESYQLALSLKPKFARARRWYAGLVAQFGRFDDALAHSRLALADDPFDRSAAPAIGLYLFLARRYEEAVQILTEAIRSKDMIMTRWNLTQVYAWMGRKSSGSTAGDYFRKALEQAAAVEVVEKSDRGPNARAVYADQVFALTYALMGDTSTARIYRERMEADVEQGGTSPAGVAWAYAAEGQTARACDFFDLALTRRDRRLLYVKVLPFLENMRGVERFETLLKTMKL